MSKINGLLTIGAIMLFLNLPVYAVKLSLSEPFPTAWKTVTVSLEDLAEDEDPTTFWLKATFRPNSSTEGINNIAAFSKDGTLDWRPTGNGIVKLSAEGPVAKGSKEMVSRASIHCAVRFEKAPALGLAVMIFAGLILFGGTLFFFHAVNFK